MCEADDIFKELLWVFVGLIHLEGKKTDPNNVIPENKGAQDVCIFPVLFRGFVWFRATSHQLDNVQNLIKQLHCGTEFFIGDFVSLFFDSWLLDASPVQCTVEEVKWLELERDSNVTHIDFERNYRQFDFWVCLAIELVLFFGCFIRLLLGAIVFSFGAYTDRLKDKILNLEHMVGIVFFHSDSVFANVFKELFK